MQTRMKMDRKRKSAVGTVIKNVKWSSVFWRETEMVGGEVSLVKLNTFMLWPWVNQSPLIGSPVASECDHFCQYLT